MRRDLKWWLAALLILNGLGGLAESQAPLLAPEFKKLWDAIIPRKTETWQKVPWRTDLLDARGEAAKLRRPLFLWSMNGHPLGCT